MMLQGIKIKKEKIIAHIVQYHMLIIQYVLIIYIYTHIYTHTHTLRGKKDTFLYEKLFIKN